MRFTVAILLFINLVFAKNTFAQIKVNGGFVQDSIKLGERASFYLAVKYPKNQVVLYPDSSHNFSPFQYKNRRYFASVTNDSITSDSAVYFVNTFELGSSQKLSLPVYLLNKSDCTKFKSNIDSIRITETASLVPDSVSVANLPLKIDTTYKSVPTPLNVSFILIITGSILSVAALVWIIFGKKIETFFVSKKLNRNHSNFISVFERMLQQLRNEFSPDTTEEALFTWKKYMEQLEAKPYTKLTTAETLQRYGDEALAGNLRMIDRAIYGHDRNVLPALEQLRTVADVHFQNKLKEVAHGK